MKFLKEHPTIILSVSALILGLASIHYYFNAGGILSTFANGTEPHHKRIPIPSPEVIKKLPKDGGPEYNRLIFEKSPYLLQHARNPVDWYPWGEEAFERARRDEKPIFLSVGYTTCHWCHVMERESFEDEEVAALLNQYFVCIKVDREERPDIDQVYMTVTQVMTGSGGWPMTVIMTPEKKPYFAGTYFPKSGRFGRPGMMELVPRLGDAWKKERERVLEISENITGALVKTSGGSPGGELTEKTLHDAYEGLESRYDSAQGGFGRSPKFPTPHNLSFLLRYWKRTGKAKALEMVEKTLTEMRLGGVYDQVGFGTHRYSTDSDWLLPHFEKMLYDQALLAIANIETWQATGKESYAQTAREIFTYVLRDMTSPEGGFYSAEDADSEGEEGIFYVWKPEEIHAVLGDEDGALFIKVFNILRGGNFEDQTTRRKTGDSIPHLKKPISEIAKSLSMKESNLRSKIEAARQKLFDVREKRIHPQKDDKILTDWNGLMIAALAKGGRALDQPQYTDAAKKAADFVLSNLRQTNGRLLKRYRQGEAGLPAHLEDYAFMVWGLIELYEATFEVHYLQEAIHLNDLMVKHFWDEKKGGFFMTADDGEKLLVRSKDIYDGAIPSGNSVAALNLIRLGRITAKEEYEQKVDSTIKAFSGSVRKRPSAHAQLMIALGFAIGPSFEIVLSGDLKAKESAEMLRALRRRFLPNKVVLFRPESPILPAITKIAPYTETQKSTGSTTTAYVCQDFACRLPTTDVAVMLKSLGFNE